MSSVLKNSFMLKGVGFFRYRLCWSGVMRNTGDTYCMAGLLLKTNRGLKTVYTQTGAQTLHIFSR